jgi:hypothetical protein
MWMSTTLFFQPQAFPLFKKEKTMANRKKPNAQDLALSELAEFPNYVAWLVLTPEGKAAQALSDKARTTTYEAALDLLLEKVVNAAADLKAKP